MKPLKITKDNNPKLREKSIEVSLPLSEEDKSLALSILEYLKLTQDEEYRKKYSSVREGVGLAAPQIGINKRIIAVSFKVGENEEITHLLVNPRIVSNSIKKCYLSGGEGCLSVDKPHEGIILRDYKIKVKAFDVLADKEVEIVAREFEAVVLQHEIDHLNGVLFYDHINKNNPNYAPDNAICL